MRRYSENVKAEVKRRMGPPQLQSVAQISKELGIHIATLYNWRHNWRLQGEVVPASAKDPEGWGPADKFMVVLETAGFNATELSTYYRERGLFPEQVDRWRQAAQDANAQPWAGAMACRPWRWGACSLPCPARLKSRAHANARIWVARASACTDVAAVDPNPCSHCEARAPAVDPA